MTVHDYFSDIADELKRKSDRMRIGFSTHRLSAGENREGVVAKFLSENLPRTFGVDTGLILAKSGEFSNQADIVVVDQTNNAPLFPGESNRLWLVEAVYALIEVKTTLSPGDLGDALQKCRRFKNLPRTFETVPALPRVPDSLFVLWAFESPSPKTVKENIIAALEGVPRAEQPDFIVVPDSILATAGGFRDLSVLGRPGSQHWWQTVERTGGNLDLALGEQIEVLDLGKNALLAFLVYLTSWLKGAGYRSAPLASYLTEEYIYGQRVV